MNARFRIGPSDVGQVAREAGHRHRGVSALLPSFPPNVLTSYDESSQLEKGLLKDLKDTINASDNLKIVPTSVYEGVRHHPD